MRYYTKTGDAGETSLYTGERVPKSSARVEAYGTMDELQAFMGLARARVDDPEVNADIEAVESKLASVMAELASTGCVAYVSDDDVLEIEGTIDKYAGRIDAHGFKFVVPGVSVPSSILHVARTVARRCERRVLAHAEREAVRPALLQYVNRLSDLLYALAVYVDMRGAGEVSPAIAGE